ncbi:hypothetical protein ACFS5L_40950 [Streptomyces phyllanthi]|uniref:Peptidase inhibitor family I36 protein n=1 Tax=Streptomyces phyllanthi TaxID=1803180 RepID=A0A5N8W6A8_9ACTN|nr:hypothetical protein [Streptomyces phyllanthi]MPY43011.1 hypothetical protein [Streptomyces phyllanthi]
MTGKFLHSACAATVLTAGLLAGSASSASADSRYGCEWPRVCFYLTQADRNANRPTAAYQDAGYNQTLGPNSRGADSVYNSRNDDIALVRVGTSSVAVCISPNQSQGFDATITITAVRIQYEPSTCPSQLMTWPS